MIQPKERVIQTIKNHYYLKSLEEDDFSCSLCFDPQLMMLKCEGYCNKLVCKQCIKDKYYYYHRKNCAGNRFSVIKRQNIQFFCPSNNEECLVELRSQQDFQNHIQQCQYVSAQLKQQFQQKKMYLCQNNHQLSFSMRRNRKCSLCNHNTYVSTCSYNQCQNYYCHQCRNIPSSKTQCPKGHNYNVHRQSAHITCDICGVSLRLMSNRQVHADRECNFDICASCHESIPQEANFIYKQPTKQLNQV